MTHSPSVSDSDINYWTRRLLLRVIPLSRPFGRLDSKNGLRDPKIDERLERVRKRKMLYIEQCDIPSVELDQMMNTLYLTYVLDIHSTHTDMRIPSNASSIPLEVNLLERPMLDNNKE